ncbi:MAG: proprotein convertase P-domain-containing protein, partial [Phycisphaerae bacterium]
TMITVDFPSGPVVPAGSDLVVEIANVDDGTEPPEFFFRVMSNDLGQCGPSYLRAADCGNPGWDDLADIGFPDAHLIQSVSATVGGVVTVECPKVPEACGKGAGPCGEPNGTPGCEDELCCAAVCAINPLCCLPGFGWDSKCVDIAIELGCAAPVNDLCEDAIPIKVPSFTLGSTDGANIDDTFSSCGTAITSPGVWYSVMGTGTTITATTCTDFFGYDTKISVYCGSCDVPFCVTGNDDDCPDGANEFLSTVTWCSRSGEEYLILVHGFGGDSGDFELDVFEDGVGCEPDFACAPAGACCLVDECFSTTAKDCAAQGGDYQGDLTECGSGDPLIFEASPEIPIPDATPAGVSDTINVLDAIIIGDLNVGLTITHTWVGDLCVSLEHNGVVVNLIQRPGADTGVPCHSEGPFGCSDDNYAGIVLDDAGAGGSIEDACDPDLTSPPNYVPNEALSAFNGMDSSGDWTITVSDNAGQDLGTFNSWSLAIKEPGCPEPPNQCPWDLDDDGNVGVPDLLELILAWGTDPGGPPDFNGDGDVGVPDLLELILNWGACP